MSTSVLMAIMAREGKIRVTNLLFIFWDLFYPLGYLLVFGVGINASLGFTTGDLNVDYNAFFLAGVLAMASFGIASNTSWSFFLDRDNGIFYEMLTYPMSRSQYLLGKVLFNVLVAVLQTAITILLAAALLGVPLRIALVAAARARHDRRHGRLVLLLRDLRAAHPAQRRVQHGDVDFLLRVPVRQLDVLSARAAAVRVPGGGLRESHHLAGRRPPLPHDRHGRSGDDRASSRRRFWRSRR